MKPKKIFSLIAALLAMLMVLSACGAASSTPSTTQAASQSTDTQPAAINEKIFLVFILFPPDVVDFFALLTYNKIW